MITVIDYNTLLKVELAGVYGNHLARVQQINRWYAIYDGDQEWAVAEGLDYVPTKRITNLIAKLIDTRARFMFGREPFFDVRPVAMDEEGSTLHQDKAQKKEDLLNRILSENKFHSKLLKARKDCSIGGKVAIKLWAHKDKGLKIVFSPAQEFFPQFNLDDVDELEKIIFLYALNDEQEAEDQRIRKQVWEMVNGKCVLNEGTYNGHGELVSTEYADHDTGLDFIPVVIVQNAGLTGETEGKSDVQKLWPNQDSYNKLNSDDLDALKFQMFGQDIVIDATENSLKSIVRAPGALVDLQTEAYAEGKQAKMERLESRFSYADKFKDSVDRAKSDMYELMEVPNVSLEQLRGIMQSGKSMKALYWGLISACEEDWTEWGPALEQMAEYIFKMVDVYKLYGAQEVARYETTLNIERYYPIQEDEDDQKRVDMEEVAAHVRSRKSYMNKWSEAEDIDSELEQIQLEKQMLNDDFGLALERELRETEPPAGEDE